MVRTVLGGGEQEERATRLRSRVDRLLPLSLTEEERLPALEAAIHELRQARDAEPENPFTQYVVGDVLRSLVPTLLGCADLACCEARRLAPDGWGLLTWLAVYWMERGFPKVVAKHLHHALECLSTQTVDPIWEATIRHLLGSAYERLGKRSEAQNEYIRAIDIATISGRQALAMQYQESLTQLNQAGADAECVDG